MLSHFFSHQSVIPRRVQHKYFPLIRKKLLERITFIKSRASQKRDRNHSTKTFFNFSYKRCHFYFGIYTPCNNIIDNPQHSGAIGLCKIPSPIILSHNRRACVSHQCILQRFENIKSHSNNSAVSTLSDLQYHTDLIYQRWKSKETKRIYLNRLGISYTSCYINNKRKVTTKDGSLSMYMKRIENFSHLDTTSKKTQTRQQRRFDSACRRIFNKDKNLRSDTNFHKRVCGTHFNFLLSNKQHCQKLLSHQKHEWRNGCNILRPYSHPTSPIRNDILGPTLSYASGSLQSYIEKKRGIFIPNNLFTREQLRTPNPTLNFMRRRILFPEENILSHTSHVRSSPITVT
ncbi:hypothetical protein RhiirA4_470897 [Rhizophagus irregularis]|uniref:DUF8211 domain-containing protein n=1 Tax=Rhizophagus irregularis TaxID=588596 RepID=A0A2I1H237_9GLOM|nr:hypothetical protein RhiirA4_470897 [Rhizophagus irregularis]